VYPETYQIQPTKLAGIYAVAADSARSFSRHFHDAYCIGVIDRGAQRWFSDRRLVEAGAGTVIMCNPGEIHDGRPLGPDGRAWRMLNIAPQIIHDVLADSGMASARTYAFSFPLTRHPLVGPLVENLFESLRDGGDVGKLTCLLLRLLPLVGHVRADDPLRRHPPGVEVVKRMIDEAPTAPFHLRDLAAVAGISPWHLVRVFARETGCTPHAYQVQRRVLHARSLMAAGVALPEVALASGFADQSHMTRVFKRAFGYTPGVWLHALL
jgi:AraC-like DNA-binding protein